MLAVTRAEIKNEREPFHTEVSLWRCEVSYLYEEYRKAIVDLQRLEAALRQRAQALEAYAAALDGHEQRLAAEEWGEPVEDEGSPVGGPTPQGPTGTHVILKHWRLREDHERIKTQHCAVLASWSLLLRTACDPR